MLKAILMALGLLLSGSCFAERLLPASFIGQPVLLMKEGSIQSCGIRFVGYKDLATLTKPNEPIWFTDASFMLDRRGYGMVKAVLTKTTLAEINAGSKKKTEEPFTTFWIKAPNVDATNPINGKTIDGDSRHSKLYATKLTSVISLYDAVVAHKPIQLGLKFKDSKDFAFYGEVTLSDKDLAQVSSCMDELINLMQKDLKEK